LLDLTVLGRSPQILYQNYQLQHFNIRYRCINYAKDFIVSGTAENQLFGTCESLWEPDLEPEDLFETISQALLNSLDRDAMAGWGAHVYIITKDKVVKRLLKGMFCTIIYIFYI